jgi:hypothetical protein
MLIVSTVVNRWLHAGHILLRRIAVPSSLLRESTTRVSAERQNGQFMAHLLAPTGYIRTDSISRPWGSPWG